MFTAYIIVFTIVLCIYTIYIHTNTVTVSKFVNFRDKALIAEYNKQNIQHNNHTGTLSNCRFRKKKACTVLHYKAPTYQTNEPNGFIMTDNKASTNRILQLNRLPIPSYVYVTKTRASRMIFEEFQMLLQAHRISFPVVVKPVNGFDGRGVHMNVRTIRECLNLMHKISTEGMGTIVQQQVQGHHYRILVVNGRVIDILEDVPPRVVGDGTTPVDQLIRAFNRRRKAQGKYTTDVVHWDYIREQLGVPSTATTPIQVVPKRGRTVYITQLKNGYNGVDRLSVPLTAVPARVKDLSVRVAQVLGLNLIGIDYMCADIRRDVPGYIIEVNSVPDYTPHAKQEGAHRPVSRRFVQALFA